MESDTKPSERVVYQAVIARIENVNVDRAILRASKDLEMPAARIREIFRRETEKLSDLEV